MYKSEADIFEQHTSLRQTVALMQGQSGHIKDFFGISGFYSMTFSGSGVMYSLCRSAELSMKLRGGLSSISCVAGDLAINMKHYRSMLDGTLMIVPSRSGNTSEVIMAVEKAKRDSGAQAIGVTVLPDSKLSGVTDMCVEIPWASDGGMCSLKSASNIFLANLYIVALVSGDNRLLDEIKDAADNHEKFIRSVSAELEKIGRSGTWDKVAVLADGELAGVAEAGALTFTRMCGVVAGQSGVLDVRHGKLPAIDSKTLVVAAVSPLDDVYQSVLMRELRDRGATLVTVAPHEENIFGSDLNVVIPPYECEAVRGLPLLFVLQALAYHKAVADGNDPDAPKDIARWVRL